MSDSKNVGITFELIGDEFPHGWFFNRFRVERIGRSVLVTFALATDSSGALATNAVVLSDSDLQNNRDRSMSYLKEAPSAEVLQGVKLAFSSPPARVYPVNHFNLSRIDQIAEIGFFRFSIGSVAANVRESNEQPNKKHPSVKSYPIVMFRCDFEVQIALIKDLYTT